MDTHKNICIPPTELKYWTMGSDPKEPVTQQSAPLVWQEYLERHKAGDWLAALCVINRLISFDPNQPEHWRIKAKLHGAIGHSGSCLLAIEQLIRLVPGDIDALRMKAIHHHCHHEHGQALGICTQVLDKTPDSTEFKILREAILSSMESSTP